MTKIIPLFLLLCGFHVCGQAVIYSTGFQNGIPNDFTLINNDLNIPATQVSEFDAAWICVSDPENPMDSIAASTSYFNVPDTADRWMITPSLALGSFGNKFYWNAKSQDASFPDDYYVLVSVTDNSPESFLDTVGYIEGENFEWTERSIDLSDLGYDNQSIFVAFVLRTYDGFKLYIDDIEAVKEDETGIDENGLPFFRIGEYKMKPMQYENTIFMENNLRIEAMDKLGIDLQLLSPNPLTMFHKIEGEVANEFCKIHNDAMVESINEYPERLLGSATVPLQDIGLSCKELERSIKDLGLSSVSAGTDLPFGLDDPKLDEFYQTVVDLNIPLFLHPASSGGAKGPDDWRMGRYDMSIMLGYAYEETLAVATLIIGGVMDRHPNLDICISHGRGAMPY